MKKIIPLILISFFLISCSNEQLLTKKRYSDYPKASEKLENPTSDLYASVESKTLSEKDLKKTSEQKTSFNYVEETKFTDIETRKNRTFEKKDEIANEVLASSRNNVAVKHPAKRMRRNYKGETKTGIDNINSSGLTLLEVVVAIILPPLAMFLFQDDTGQFLLNILLWLLFYIPGLIHALIILNRS